MSGALKKTLGLYALVVGVVLFALAFVTAQTLGLERSEHEAREQTRFNDKVRTALWRFENAMAPIVARESARPYFQYRAFFPVDRAYSRMLQEIEPGDVIMPSPLLCAGEDFIKLHFQRSLDGTLGSPTAPTGVEREKQEAVYCSPQRIADAEFSLQALAGLLEKTDLTARLAEAQSHRGQLIAGGVTTRAFVTDSSLHFRAAGPGQGGQGGQGAVPDYDKLARAMAFTRTTRTIPAHQQMNIINLRNDSSNVLVDPGQRDALAANDQAGLLRLGNDQTGNIQTGSGEMGYAGPPTTLPPPPAADDLSVEELSCLLPVVPGPFVPLWVDGVAGPELLMVRSVTVGTETFEQGMWFDWPQLREFLLAQVNQDLLRNAILRPLRSDAELDKATNPLMSITAELVPGADPLAQVAGWTPTRSILVLAWMVVAAGAVAIYRMLVANVELAERRGRFVSAVTHELRTPLTTFCMYSQMLADGLVRDESSRQEYFVTLRDQSKKLASIVEDVLSYARLSRRGGKAPASESQASVLAETIERSLPALRARAEAAGMRIEVQGGLPTGLKVAAESQGIERIIANLVDNAAKYACDASDKRIVVRSGIEGGIGGRAFVEVEDFGPGIAPKDRARLFEAFERGETHDRSAIPGLGLGLSLARGMAREFGGDLKLAESSTSGSGARFVLFLNVVAASQEPVTRAATA